MQIQYKYLDNFVNEQRAMGKYSFSLQDIRDKFQLSDNTLWKALQRLKRQKEIAMVRKEFYVIVPPEYRANGIIPTSLFIDDLMKFLERDYYVGLLNAAVYHGAAHQQPQDFSVITKGSHLRKIYNNKVSIRFYIKKEWAKEDIIQQKVNTGYLNISSPELTALDIVNYFNEVGGFNRIATILEELVESMEGKEIAKTAQRYEQVVAVQRLGYLLEEVLQQPALSNSLFEYLQSVKFFPVLLRPQKEKPDSMTTGNRWKVVPNVEIETDL